MPRLVFDFPDHDRPPASGDRPSAASRVVFRDPVEVVSAETIEGVRPALDRVHRAASEGLHAAGFVSYEAAPAFEPAMRVHAGHRLPLVWFGLFEGPETPDRGGSPPDRTPDRTPEWTLDWTRAEYADAVADVREAIAAGRTYQVNLTARLRARLDGEPWDGDEAAGEAAGEAGSGGAWRLYERMRRAQGSGYHAFLDLGRHAILSVSPELFFRRRGREILTRPMKGTRRRGRWPEEDGALEWALASSEKDRAENLMIVDLLRNDLGRICETGSVEVTRLHAIERYRTVWQMTSTVAGRVPGDATLTDVFAALFPCGSVTGAPKISTMAEIARLETSPREVYCGAIGWVRPGGDCTFSVAIRTAWLDRVTRQAEYGAGGGVVWDSSPDAELDELRAKAVVVREPWPEFELLETLALRDGAFVRKDRHLERMRRSADYFGFPWPATRLETALDELAARYPHGASLARLTLSDDGAVSAAAHSLDSADRTPPAEQPGAEPGGEPGVEPGSEPLPLVVLSPDPVDSTDRFLFHKTTHRGVYDARRAGVPEAALDALLRNERGEVTEFTRGNVVMEIDGERVTPARESGLLAGCLRQELLEEGVVAERVVHVSDLDRASRLWFINSARGWIEVELKWRVFRAGETPSGQRTLRAR